MTVTLNTIEEFLRQPKPRSVPGDIFKKALKNSFGGALGFVLGIFFFIFGAVFSFIFFPWTIGTELQLDMGTPEIAEGKITSTEKTSMSVGGGKHSKGTPVYRIRFSFNAEGKNDIRGVSYVTGNRYSRGSGVRIEYIKGSPESCRIKGLRTSAFGYGGLFVVIFPAVGAVIFIIAFNSRRKTKTVLQNGEFSMGQIAEVKATNVKVNNQTRYKVSVSFDLNGFDKTSTYNAYGPAVSFARNKMESEEPVGILYNPDNDKQLIVIDSLLD
ncbi:MAG: hypothetical protein ACYTFY_15875 [Planctomycetota bacterium]|jgi:hypothetical protein